MEQRTDRIGLPWGFDRDTNRELVVEYSVEITDECPRRNGGTARVILDFTQLGCDIQARILNCYMGDEGIPIVRLVKQLEDLDSEFMAPFNSMAKDFGLSPEALVLIIKDVAPRVDRDKTIRYFQAYSQAPDNSFEQKLRHAGLRPGDLA